MTINHFFFDGAEFPELPDPFLGVSPMTPERFVRMGGEVREAEYLTDKELFLAGLDEYLDELERQAEALALDITKDEFKAAAGSMMSSALIAWAKEKGVPDEMIDAVRERVLELIADASRIGLTWCDLFPQKA